MDKLVSIGFNTSVNKSKIILIMPPGSAPIKRKIQEAREIGKLVDCSNGRKTRAVIFCDDGVVILSGIAAETIRDRWNGIREEQKESED